MVSKLKTFIRVLLTVQNWPSVLIGAFLLKRITRVIFRTGYSFEIIPPNFSKFHSFTSFFRHFSDGQINGSVATINYKAKKLSFDFDDTAPGTFAEFFGKKFPYQINFDTALIKDRIVVDVGAYLGDSPVWFAVHGAKVVYSFEPITSYFNLAKRNIDLNKFSDVCILTQAAIAGEKGNDFFKLELNRQVLGLGEGLKNERAKTIPLLTLKDIIEINDIKGNAFLKMDCEGYEYDILLNCEDRILRKFDFVMMEYHLGYVKLKEKLEGAGFRVKHTEPERVYQASAGEDFKELLVGYIFANRIYDI